MVCIQSRSRSIIRLVFDPCYLFVRMDSHGTSAAAEAAAAAAAASKDVGSDLEDCLEEPGSRKGNLAFQEIVKINRDKWY